MPSRSAKPAECLNPFEFRASVRTDNGTTAGSPVVLIPLNSGHQSGPDLPHKPKRKGCLNPFEFRASVRTRSFASLDSAVKVLIPLNSGHQSGPSGRASITTWACVLIPLNSGHQSGLLARKNSLQSSIWKPGSHEVRRWPERIVTLLFMRSGGLMVSLARGLEQGLQGGRGW